MKTLHIAIINENWGAGAARCARDLARELGRRHEVRLYPRTKSETHESLSQDLEKFHPDVVHCHSFYSWLDYGFLAKVSRTYPTLCTIHDPRPIGTMDKKCWACDYNAWCVPCPLIPSRWRKIVPNRFSYNRLKKRITHFRCASDMVVVAPSRWMLNRLCQQELRRFRHELIFNGIDLDHFREIPDARRRFSFGQDELVILHVAYYERRLHLNDRKGLPLLFQAFLDHVLPRFPDAVLAVAGEQVVPNHPRVKPLGLVGQADLPSLLSAADIYATATIADNLPYTVSEAMACGRPVVGTAVGGVPEQIVDGRTGLVVPSRDASALGNALTKLLADEGLRRRLGEEGRRRAQELFGLEKCVSTYEQLFIEMSNAKRHQDQGSA